MKGRHCAANQVSGLSRSTPYWPRQLFQQGQQGPRQLRHQEPQQPPKLCQEELQRPRQLRRSLMGWHQPLRRNRFQALSAVPRRY